MCISVQLHLVLCPLFRRRFTGKSLYNTSVLRTDTEVSSLRLVSGQVEEMASHMVIAAQTLLEEHHADHQKPTQQILH